MAWLARLHEDPPRPDGRLSRFGTFLREARRDGVMVRIIHPEFSYVGDVLEVAASDAYVILGTDGRRTRLHVPLAAVTEIRTIPVVE